MASILQHFTQNHPPSFTMLVSSAPGEQEQPSSSSDGGGSTFIVQAQGSHARRRRSEFASLQDWVEYKRALERGYDAKRRAIKKAQGPELSAYDRRIRREAAEQSMIKNLMMFKESSDRVFDNLVLAIQAYSSSSSPALVEASEDAKSGSSSSVVVVSSSSSS